ncbi:MAG: hypothetical protein FJW32_05145, partial [Acidobacteria bacterium]|nr:hypothetical protein [Acidobacteriota bacterium]
MRLLALALASMIHLAAAETVALWLFDEQRETFPSSLLNDAATGQNILVLGRGGQLVAGRFGNALEPHNLKSGATSVPRKELLHNLRVFLETGAIVFADGLRHRERLIRECSGVKASGTTVDHDDLVVAVALA